MHSKSQLYSGLCLLIALIVWFTDLAVFLCCFPGTLSLLKAKCPIKLLTALVKFHRAMWNSYQKKTLADLFQRGITES